MTDTMVPPEGQLSFSGIPKAEFIEDVDSHMAGEESAETHLKVRTNALKIWHGLQRDHFHVIKFSYVRMSSAIDKYIL